MTLFQELIWISLGKRNAFSRKLTDDDWLELYKEAQRQSLVGVLLAGVEKVVASGADKPTFLMQWIAKVLALEKRNQLLNAQCREVTELFNKLGVRTCVLKGQGSAMLYPDSLRRQCGDIDIWVEGKRDSIYRLLRRNWKMGKTVVHHADVEIFSDTPVEVHFVPSFCYSPFRYRKYKSFFRRYGDIQFANYDIQSGFSHPEVEFNAVYSLMHIFHHVLHEGIGLRQMLDYYYILKNLEERQKPVVCMEVRRLGLARFASAVMYVEQQVFGLEEDYLFCPSSEPLGVLLLSEIEKSGNFGFFDGRNKKVRRNSRLALYWHNVSRNFMFFRFSPSEVLWTPIWKPCHFIWRKIKGYS